jgi:hypothetical protein
MAVLNKIDDVWSATESPDNQESEEFVSSIEERIAESVNESGLDGDISPVPVPELK